MRGVAWIIVFVLVMAWMASGALDRTPAPPSPFVPDASERATLPDDPALVRELGIAAFPGSEPTSRARMHLWRARPTDPHRYRVGYALGTREHAAVDRDFRRFAESIGYEDLGDSFRFQPSERCRKGLFCAWSYLAKRDRASVRPLAQRFREFAAENRLDSLELVRLVVTFVQHIPYTQDMGWTFGIAPPADVAYHRRGDCDSKALLAALVLQELGVGAVMLSSDVHRHAMLGIDVPTGESRTVLGGRSYAMTEVTHPGWPIGRVPPEVRVPNDWTGAPLPAE
jgi:hypothetical protein